MLNGIPSLLSPHLIKILMEMGHGDEIVFADAHFPAESIGKQVVRGDGNTIPHLLKAILPFFPLDSYVLSPVALMDIEPGESKNIPIWSTYEDLISDFMSKEQEFEYVARESFYNRSKKAYAIIATSETSQYANVILKKGIVKT